MMVIVLLAPEWQQSSSHICFVVVAHQVMAMRGGRAQQGHCILLRFCCSFVGPNPCLLIYTTLRLNMLASHATRAVEVQINSGLVVSRNGVSTYESWALQLMGSCAEAGDQLGGRSRLHWA